MLCLGRAVGEEIVIGENIRVKLLGTKGKRAVIGIAAPREVRVHRLEVHQCVQDSAEERCQRSHGEPLAG